jgi:hypothetical protein
MIFRSYCIREDILEAAPDIVVNFAEFKKIETHPYL